jgi:hypothetical protein
MYKNIHRPLPALCAVYENDIQKRTILYLFDKELTKGHVETNFTESNKHAFITYDTDENLMNALNFYKESTTATFKNICIVRAKNPTFKVRNQEFSNKDRTFWPNKNSDRLERPWRSVDPNKI